MILAGKKLHLVRLRFMGILEFAVRLSGRG